MSYTWWINCGDVSWRVLDKRVIPALAGIYHGECSSFLVFPCPSWLYYLPKCEPYPGQLSILVLDNAWIGHKNKSLELIDCFGIRLEYLPPYSPDLNPIKEAFSKIKHYLHCHNSYYAATTGDGILYNMLELWDVITAHDAKEYFAHAGYF
jgi:hypothetical protein